MFNTILSLKFNQCKVLNFYSMKLNNRLFTIYSKRLTKNLTALVSYNNDKESLTRSSFTTFHMQTRLLQTAKVLVPMYWLFKINSWFRYFCQTSIPEHIFVRIFLPTQLVPRDRTCHLFCVGRSGSDEQPQLLPELDILIRTVIVIL